MCILCINQNNEWYSLVAPGKQLFKLNSIIPCGFLRMRTETVMPKKLFPLMQRETDTQIEFCLLGYNIIQSADVSEKHADFIFRVKYTTSKKQHKAGSKHASVPVKH
jgi:hypothetical protein